MIDYLLLIIGLAILAIGGDSLVRGAVGLAENFHIPPLVIGLTIVAIGTSLPEMIVSVQAALAGAAGIAIGNVVGSNIANILLVLALPSLIRATVCDERGVGRNLLVMIGITIVFMGMLANGRLSRSDGLILLVLTGLVFYDQLRSALNHRRAVIADGPTLEIGAAPHRPAMIALLVAGGVAALPVGAEMTIRGASAIAESWGVSQEAIGLTVVAVGTSLPELATSLLAVIRKNHSVALGNVVGSNIFNIGLIMGATAALAPMAVAERIVTLDMWVMLAASLLVAVLAHYGVVIGKRLAVAMLAAYVLYAGLSYAI